MNDRCYNCHGRNDRNKLLLFGDVEIGYDDVEQLCAKCHGTTYRDWQAGMHGRTNGSWDAQDPRQRRLKCTQCHDPHAPAYDAMVPMPAPNTLRQGPQDPEGGHGHGKRSPLTKWRDALEGAEVRVSGPMTRVVGARRITAVDGSFSTSSSSVCPRSASKTRAGCPTRTTSSGTDGSGLRRK